MKILNEIIDSLSEKEKHAILHCEEEGNGNYFYQIHKLLEKGLMDFVPIPRLMNIKAPRLNKTGLIIRDLLGYIKIKKEVEDKYYAGIIKHANRYKDMLIKSGKDEYDITSEFCDELILACRSKLPLCKLNRWLGYIQREVISLGLSSVSFERDITRSDFRPLDFNERF
jgi:hypothetical protein